MIRRGVKSLYKVHAYAGLIGGVLLTVVAVSGTVAVFKDDVDRLANPELRTVTPRGERRPWAELAEVVRREYSGARMLHMTIPGEPDEERPPRPPPLHEVRLVEPDELALVHVAGVAAPHGEPVRGVQHRQRQRLLGGPVLALDLQIRQPQP